MSEPLDMKHIKYKNRWRQNYVWEVGEQCPTAALVYAADHIDQLINEVDRMRSEHSLALQMIEWLRIKATLIQRKKDE